MKNLVNFEIKKVMLNRLPIPHVVCAMKVVIYECNENQKLVIRELIKKSKIYSRSNSINYTLQFLN